MALREELRMKQSKEDGRAHQIKRGHQTGHRVDDDDDDDEEDLDQDRGRGGKGSRSNNPQADEDDEDEGDDGVIRQSMVSKAAAKRAIRRKNKMRT
jgi:hypothetical protein